jgi:RNA polymerase-binding transcription factor DksA
MKQGRKRGTTRRTSGGRKTASTTRAILGRDGAAAKAIPINPRWAWHYRVLLGLRDRLLKDRGEQLAQSAERLEPYSMDMADSATDEFDHDLALSQLSAEQDALYEVEEALHRILEGAYGICEESGKVIPAARLRAIPWTRFAKEVETRLEKKGVVAHARLGKLRSVREAKSATLAPTADEVETKELRMENAEKEESEAIQRQEKAEPAEGREEQET